MGSVIANSRVRKSYRNSVFGTILSRTDGKRVCVDLEHRQTGRCEQVKGKVYFRPDDDRLGFETRDGSFYSLGDWTLIGFR
ncbi:MAG: hypothetical protein RJQ08_10790 [Salinisphaeraceae bacterium]